MDEMLVQIFGQFRIWPSYEQVNTLLNNHVTMAMTESINLV